MNSAKRTARFALSALAGAILLMGPAIAITASKAEGCTEFRRGSSVMAVLRH